MTRPLLNFRILSYGVWLSLAVSAGCGDDDTLPGDASTDDVPSSDASSDTPGSDASDGGLDGFLPDTDARDAGPDALVGPCDGGPESLWYFDADGDGLGDAETEVAACEMPADHVNNGDDPEPDCATNDTDFCDLCGGDGSTCDDCAGVFDGEALLDMCGICSGGTSDHVADTDQDICGVCFGPGEQTFYIDIDGDGLGDAAVSVNACIAPDGYVDNGDDAQPACGTNDNDTCGVCAGPGQLVWYLDQDSDGLGDPSMSQNACLIPPGYVADGSDSEPTCGTNDTDECGVCAGSGGGLWYRDQDADGLGDPAMSMRACTIPVGYVNNDADAEPACDTNDTDVCGACGGNGETAWYRDQDGDGLGDSAMAMSTCSMPAGYVSNSDDTEPDCATNDTDVCGVCGGVGTGCQDCAGVVDGSARDDGCGECSGGTSGHVAESDRDACDICFGPGPSNWYSDTDGDGLGDPAESQSACEAPAGYVDNGTDSEPTCATNDTDACNVCGGPGAITWYRDQDGDGQGDPSISMSACTQPSGYVANNTDTQPTCATNDTDVCGVCGGPGEMTWYRDQDGDGLGDPGTSTLACTLPAGYVANSTDTEPLCATNDTDVCGVCGGPGEATWYADQDGDGLGDPSMPANACVQPAGYVGNSSDAEPTCGTNDTDACGVCGGPGAATWYLDQDNDGLGDPSMSVSACSMPAGYVANNSDTEPTCATNDTDVCGVCAGPGQTTWYNDQDNDGLGDPAMSMSVCSRPAGYVGNNSDTQPNCATNDEDACGVCAGPGMSTWYADSDDDGYGNPAAPATTCVQPANYVSDMTDCDDGAGMTYPGATDWPDMSFVDANCDGIDGDIALAWFVMLGAAGGDGSMANPWGSIAQAFVAADASATRKHVFVGGSTGSTTDYVETLALPSGVSLFGLYRPLSTWSRSLSAVTQLRSTSVIGLQIDDYQSPSVGMIQGMVIRSADATVAEETSIAVRAIDVRGTLTIDACTLIAGDGANGVNGVDGSDGCEGGVNANGGLNDRGGRGGTSCSASDNGGDGGWAGRRLNGVHASQVGDPSSEAVAGGSRGRDRTESNSFTCSVQTNGRGGGGANGSVGSSGTNGSAPAADAAYGTTVVGYQWHGHDGAHGSRGTDGQHGGGGGGGGYCRHNTVFPALDIVADGGGGGGGGKAGTAGGAGLRGSGAGGSFALFVYVVPGLRVEHSILQAGAGGEGGMGGDGGVASQGRNGGAGAAGEVLASATGGRGGNGGRGGRGGASGGASGGGGGISAALVLQSTFVLGVGNTLASGAGGTGGAGGCRGVYLSGSCVGTVAPGGLDGLVCGTLNLSADTCVP